MADQPTERGLSRRSFIRGAAIGLGAAGVAGAAGALGATDIIGPGAMEGFASRQDERRVRRDRPNFVVIMADDLGYSDIGCYGSEIATPNLDRLAHHGTRLTGFTTNPRCVPTRASLMTGLYPTQVDLGWATEDLGMSGYRGSLSARCVTVAEVLKEAGYQTALSGKWHLSRSALDVPPASRGFVRSFGPLGGAPSYFRPAMYRDGESLGAPDDGDFYLTDAIAQHAAESIAAMAPTGQPFFSYVAFNAPHWPLHARADDINHYRGRYLLGWEQLRGERFERQRGLGVVEGVGALPPLDPAVPRWGDTANQSWQDARMATYAAQVSALDAGVGQVLNALQTNGVRDDTVVLFLGDNGGSGERLGRFGAIGTHTVFRTGMRPGNFPWILPGPSDTYASYGSGWASASNTPYSRYKHWTHEGGIATPAIVWWPARMAPRESPRESPGQSPGRIDDRPLHVIDVMPTFVELAGAEYPQQRGEEPIPPMEGRSFAAMLSGRAGWDRSRRVFIEHEGNRAVRQGRWKLVSDAPGRWQLYDLEADRAEQRDLASRHPRKAVELAADYRQWARRTGVMPFDRSRLTYVGV